MSYICDKFTEEEINKLGDKGADWHPSGAIHYSTSKIEDHVDGLWWWMDLINDYKWVKSDWTCDELIEALDTDIKAGLRFEGCLEKYCIDQ